MVRHLKRRSRTRIWLGAVVILLVLAARLLRNGDDPDEVESLAPGSQRVQRVVDGDTLLLADQSRIRLIGVNTPEMDATDAVTKASAEAAKHFTEQFVRDGDVELRFDRERLDKYGRFLAYVYVKDTMLNEQLIRQGFGRAMLSRKWNYSDSFRRLFRQAQEESQSAKRGIWSE
jgi:micrococcal nuclease